MRKQHFIYLLGMMLAVAGCKDADNGQSAANEKPVADGQIVLIKRKNEVAAFILRKQRGSPEQTDYAWFYRSDGRGHFAVGDPAVTTGIVSNATKISFATFSIDWSINTDGIGWVYFSALPTQLGKPTDYAMCVTTETNLSVVDANDRRWKYRSRPGVNIKALIKPKIKMMPNKHMQPAPR